MQLIYRNGGTSGSFEGMPGVKLDRLQDGTGRITFPGKDGIPHYCLVVHMDAGELALVERSLGIAAVVAAPKVAPVVSKKPVLKKSVMKKPLK